MSVDLDRVKAALPGYEVGGELGRGGWGVVFEGRHLRLGRAVAIKQLSGTLAADERVRTRFESEARVLAQLDHPHIVPVYDFVEDAGLYLLVMEKLTGGTLRDRFLNKTVTMEMAVAAALATCAALAGAHVHGILHRDVKPENIMFSASGVLKVTDFGIAKVLGKSLSLEMTQAGEVLGTPAYMAPEQGEGKKVTVASDLYAVATMLYELLAGRLPFDEADHPLLLLYRRIYEKPIPLSEAAPHVPKALADVVMKSLARDPAERHESAEAFSVALAEAATSAWDAGWLNRSGLTVLAAAPLVGTTERSAPATGEAVPTAAEAVPRVSPGTASGGTAPPAPPRWLSGSYRSPLAGPASTIVARTPSVALDDSGAAPSRRVLVGREPELAQLEAALDAAKTGAGRIALLAGEPGIGKTRIAEELSERAGTDVDIAWGRCHAGDAAPAYWPWVQIIRTLAYDIDAEIVRAALATGAPELAQIVPEIKELLGGDVEPLPTLEPEAARVRLYDALVGFVLRLAANRPVLLVLDDLHWADAPSLHLLQLLAAQLPYAPLLIVCTYRELEAADTAPVASTLAALARVPHVLRIRPTGLTETEVGELVAEAAGAAASGEVVEAIHDRTDGNPFFVSELVRLLTTENGLELGVTDVVRREIPAGVRDVIRLRLDRLDQAIVALLGTAAVIGRDFDLEVLAAVTQTDEDSALERIEAATTAGIVVEDPKVLGRYRFSHALVNETLYDGLSKVRRTRLHRRIGQTLAQLSPQTDARVLEIASHLYAGSAAGGVAEALDWTLRSAERANSGLAFEQAEKELHRAIELARRMAPEREAAARELEVQLRLSTLLSMTKGYGAAEVGEAYERARALAAEVGDEPELFPSLWGLWGFYCVRAEFGTAEELGEQLVELAERSANPDLLLPGHYALGITAFHLGDLMRAHDHLARAVGVCDAAEGGACGRMFGQNPAVVSRLFLGLVCYMIGEGDRAARLSSDALRMARELLHPFTLMFAVFFDAWLALFRRDVEGTRKRSEEAMAIGSEKGFRLFQAMATILHGWAIAEEGRGDEGTAEVMEGLGGVEATGSRMLMHFFLGLLAEARWRAGRLDGALEAVDNALTTAETLGERFYESELQRLRAHLLAAAGTDHQEVEAAARRAVAVARQQHAKAFEERAVESLRVVAGVEETAGLA